MPKKVSQLLSPVLDDDLMDSWTLAMQAANKRPKTVKTHLSDLSVFRGFLSPDGDPQHCSTRVADITQEDCQRFMRQLLETRKVNTALTRYASLKAFFHWCLDDDILTSEDESPMVRMKPPQNHEQPSVLILTDEQVSALLNTVRNDKSFIGLRDHAILRVLLSTGMRHRECTDLQLEDVDLAGRTIHIQRGKGGKARYGSLDAKTTQALDRYIKRGRALSPYAHMSALWLSQQGVLAYTTFDRILNTRTQQAGLEHMHVHLFRHLFAHEFLSQEGNVNSLAELAGWANLTQIMKTYGKQLANDRAIKDHQRLHIGDRW